MPGDMAKAGARHRRGTRVDKELLFLDDVEVRQGGEKLSTIENEPGILNLRSDKYTGLDVELRRNSVSDAERLLGARLALDGGGMEQNLHLG